MPHVGCSVTMDTSALDIAISGFHHCEKMTTFWDIALCSPLEVDRRFRGAYCLCHQDHDSSFLSLQTNFGITYPLHDYYYIWRSFKLIIQDYHHTPLVDMTSLNNFWIGRAVAEALSRRPLTAEARVFARVSPCTTFSGYSGTGTSFSLSSSFFLVSVIPPWLSVLIYHLAVNNRPVDCCSSET
jgi:hypothetical protein